MNISYSEIPTGAEILTIVPLLTFFFFFFSFDAKEEHSTSTEHELEKSNVPEFKPVGCFRDGGRRPRPLPKLIANFRGDIDWLNLNNTIAECARRVSEKGFRYFGLQFYGECWSGMNAHRTYNKQGTSTRCIYGVGRKKANFVYAFEEKSMFCFIFLSQSRHWGHWTRNLNTDETD